MTMQFFCTNSDPIFAWSVSYFYSFSKIFTELINKFTIPHLRFLYRTFRLVSVEVFAKISSLFFLSDLGTFSRPSLSCFLYTCLYTCSSRPFLTVARLLCDSQKCDTTSVRQCDATFVRRLCALTSVLALVRTNVVFSLSLP
jgi:hypothetical protein